MQCVGIKYITDGILQHWKAGKGRDIKGVKMEKSYSFVDLSKIKKRESVCSLKSDGHLENTYISIKKPNGFTYDIPIIRCDTPKKILHWVAHLSYKPWFDRKVLQDFLKLAYQQAGLRYY